MAVLDEKYLVGKIVEVNFTTSRVLLLSDLNSKIPVDIMPNGTLSILSGTGLNHGIIEYVRDQELIENDHTVFTSGAGGLFKSGIPVGKIEKNLTNNELKVNRTGFKTSHHDYVEIKYGSYNHKDFGYVYPEGYQFPSHTIYFTGFSISKDRNKLLTSKNL